MHVRTAFCNYTWLTSVALAACGVLVGPTSSPSRAESGSSAVFITDSQPPNDQISVEPTGGNSLVFHSTANPLEASSIATEVSQPNTVQRAAYEESPQSSQSTIRRVEHQEPANALWQSVSERAERMQNRTAPANVRSNRFAWRNEDPSYLSDSEPAEFFNPSELNVYSAPAEQTSQEQLVNECDQRLLWANKLSQEATNLEHFTTISEQCEEVLSFELEGNEEKILFAHELASWALNRRGQLHLDQSEDALADEDFQLAIEHNPRNWRALHNRAVSFAEKNSFAEAFDDFCSVIRLQPRHAKAFTNRATLYVEAGDLVAAAEDYLRAIEIDPELASAHLGLARTCHQLGRWEAAHQAFEKAIALDSDNAVAYCSRGDLLADMGRYGEALEDYAHTIELNPQFAHAYRNGAWLLATCPIEQFRDAHNALHGARQALEFNYGEEHVALDTLAAALANAGFFEEAIDTLQQAIELAPETARETYLSRMALYQQGQPFRTEPVAMISQVSYEAQQPAASNNQRVETPTSTPNGR